jgi:hypothetical protein
MKSNIRVFILSQITLLALTGCGGSSKDPDPLLSTEFATSAIDAEYSVDIKLNNIQFRAKFTHDGDILKLDTGDSVHVFGNGIQYFLSETTVAGQTFYIHSENVTPIPNSLFQFVFERTTQVDADLTVIPAPVSFKIDNIVDNEALTPTNGKVNITWSPASTNSDRFFLQYHLSCRNQSGTPSIDRNFTEQVGDDGSHDINITQILGAGDYDFCSDFDITAQRERFGSLDAALKSGSTIGRQIISVSNLTIKTL